ncbi:fluoride efflux transporter FluC [Ferviditalea candida]|uniref:Fluoride-specific ion channel FluC n=1 Tax=Ferviditalea candida TaxID=3108399 RepID=A0ABU5ZNH8_9BACL|nr:CrcB family protein [Paenibacillaceae bacterium T2]
MKIVAIGLGGFVGAFLRYAAEQWLPWPESFPLGTIVINGLGCLFLGWFFSISSTPKYPPALRLGIGIGAAGAFTTFSTFSFESVQFLSHHDFGFAALYVCLNVLGGMGLSASGSFWARRKRVT